MRKCEILVNRVRAGWLEENDNKEYTFTYDKVYLQNKEALAVSLTLPKREEPYHSKVLFPTFFNMLSEGENREYQSKL